MAGIFGGASGAAGTAATTAAPAAAQAVGPTIASQVAVQAAQGAPALTNAVNVVDQAANAARGWRGLAGKMIEGQIGTNPFTADFSKGTQASLEGIMKRYMDKEASRPTPFQATQAPPWSVALNPNAQRLLESSRRYM